MVKDMSLEWEAASITAAIEILSNVDWAFLIHRTKDTATILPRVGFAKGLCKTLEGLRGLLGEDIEVQWDSDIAEHVKTIRTGIEEFELSVRRSEIAVQEASKGLRVLSGSEILDLEDCVKSLQASTSRSQLVLEMVINLRVLSSLLEKFKNNTRTVEQLKAETQQVCHILPTIATSTKGFDDANRALFRELKDVQQHAELLVRSDLDDTKTSLLELQEVQIPLSQESRAQWQVDLGVMTEQLFICCRKHLDMLLGRHSEPDAEIQKRSWQKAIDSLARIVDGELAAGMCIAYALESYEEESNGCISMAIPTSGQIEMQENERDQKVTTLNAQKDVEQKPYLPITTRSFMLHNDTKETGSVVSSDKNTYVKSIQARSPMSNWAGSIFSKPKWGSRIGQSSPGMATPITRFQQRTFQPQNNSAQSQEFHPQDLEEPPKKSMLVPDQYSFALERWVNDSDHLEMLLNTGEQIGKPDNEVVIVVPEDYAFAVGRFPKILIKTMSDWDDAYNSKTTMTSAIGKVQFAN